MDFHINYFFERNCMIYVNITRKGRSYDRPCKLDCYDQPTFRFRGKLWRTPYHIALSYEH